MPLAPKVFAPRKLLAAALGVATIQYVGSACSSETSGNLMAPDLGNMEPLDAGEDATPDATRDAAKDVQSDGDADIGDAGDAEQDGPDSGDSG